VSPPSRQLPRPGAVERRLLRVGAAASAGVGIPIVVGAWLLVGARAAASAAIGAGAVFVLFTTLPAALAWAAPRSPSTLSWAVWGGALGRVLGYGTVLLVLGRSGADLHAPSLAIGAVVTSAVALVCAMVTLTRTPHANWIDVTQRTRSQ
jgi:hypothetical protein